MRTANNIRDRMTLAGKSVVLVSFDGEIITNRKWSESHTVSTGTGGHFNHITGEITMPAIRSYSVEQQGFWIRLLSSGTEVPCRFSGQTIPVTSGQQVRLISMQIDEQTTVNAALVNKASRRWHVLGDPGWFVHSLFYRRPSWLKAFLICLLGWFLEVAAFALLFGPGAALGKAFVQSHSFQSVMGVILDMLPLPPGAHDRGETLVFIFMLVGIVLFLSPPIYAVIKYARRYRRFYAYVDQLTASLDQFVRFAA